jgi:hypothetical protein
MPSLGPQVWKSCIIEGDTNQGDLVCDNVLRIKKNSLLVNLQYFGILPLLGFKVKTKTTFYLHMK